MPAIRTATQQWPFSPQSMPGLALWLDGADTSSMTFGSGGNVTAWKDKSIYNNNATAVGTVVLNADGLGSGYPAMAFTNTQSFTGTISNTGNTVTIFIVGSIDSLSKTDARLLSLGAVGVSDFTSTSYMCVQRFSSTTNIVSTYRNSTGNGQTVGYLTPSIFTSAADGTNVYMSLNGATSSSAASSGNFNISAYALGTSVKPDQLSSTSVPNVQLYGFIGEVIVYNTYLTTAQQKQVQGYLAWKWNIKTSLPATHPYYSPPLIPTTTSAITTPTSISGLALWLDGSDTSSMTLSGSTVTQWDDKSGNGYHATVAPGRTAALYSSAYNAVQFDNNTDAYVTSYLADPKNETMFVVFNNPSPSYNNNIIIGGLKGARSLGAGYAYHAGITYWPACGYFSNEVTWGAMTDYGSYSGNTTALVTGIISGGSTTIALNGGTRSASVPLSFTSGTTTYIGADMDQSTTYYYVGYAMEIIFYNSVLSESQITQVQNYLAAKWSIAIPGTSLVPFVNPASISGLSLWLDGSDKTSMTFSGTTITQWNDKSTNGYNATIASGRTGAIYSDAYKAVQFNASTAGYVTSHPANPTYETVFIVFNSTYIDGNSVQTLIGGMSGARAIGAGYSGTLSSGTACQYLNVAKAWNGLASTPSGSYTPGTTVVLTGKVNVATTSIALNGGTAYTGGVDVGFTAGTTTYLGMLNASQYYYSGYAMEIIFYNSVLSAPQIAQVQNYLSAKWSIIVAGAPVAPITSPLAISGTALWLDAADTSTSSMTFGASGNVTVWKDKSGLSRNATVAGTGTVVLNYAGLGTGYPAMEFTNTQSFTGSIANTGNAVTVFIVGSMNTLSQIDARFLSLGAVNVADHTSTSYMSVQRLAATPTKVNIYRNSAGVGQTISYSAPTLFTASANGTNMYLSVDGATSSSVASTGNFNISAYAVGTSVNPTQMSTGLTPNVANVQLYGFIGEVVIYNKYLTAYEQQQVQGYLATKWNLQSSLPTTHPFYSSSTTSLIINSPVITTPLSIPGTVLWLDGSDTSSMTLSGTSVTQWNDKSGNATVYNATVVPGYNAATYVSASTCLNFTNTTAYVTSYPANPTAETMFVVANNASPSASNYIIIGGGTGARSLGFGYSAKDTSTTGRHGYSQNKVAWLAPTENTSYTSGTTSLVTGCVSAGNTYISANGGTFYAPYPITNGVFSAGTTTYLGTDTTTAKGTYYFSGQVMEIICYNTVLTASQIKQVQNYLAAKWSITAMTVAATSITSPLSVPGTALWLDSSDSSTIGLTPVATTYTTSLLTWKDKSGNGYDFTNNSLSTTKPTTGSTTLGVLFSTTSSLINATVPVPSNYTIFVVGNLTATPSTWGRFINIGTTDSRGLVGTFNGTTSFDTFTGNGSAWLTPNVLTNANSPTTAVVTSPNLCIMEMVLNGTTLSPFFSGTALTARTNTAATPATTGMALNGNYVSMTQTVNGYFSEVILYNSALTTIQRQQVETYLGAKWGITVPTIVAGMTAPTSITGCTLWLDGKDSTQFVNTVLVPAYSAVTTWNDKSGLSNNMSLTAGAVTYGTSMGQSAVTFQSGGILTSANYTTLSSSTASYIFIVCQSSGTGTSDVIRLADIATDDYSIQFSAALALVIGKYGNSFRVNGVATTSTVLSAGYNLIVASGVLVSGSTRFSLSTAYNSYSFIGDIREVIVYKTITQAQILLVETYLIAKWNCGRQFWVDASDSTTITQTSSIYTWNDKSGQGNHARYRVSAYPQFTASAINGVQALSFPGTTSMDGTIALTGASITYFVVCTPSNITGASTRILSLGDFNIVDYNNAAYLVALYQVSAGVGAYRFNGGSTPVTIAANTPYVFSAVATSGNVAMYKNGGAVTNITVPGTGNFTISRYRVGSDLTQTYSFNGYVGEVIIFNTTLTTAQRQQIETYLGTKWGITVGTPVSGLTAPTSIAGCQLWLDASDSTTIAKTVSQVNDKSGNSYNLTQTTVLSQPYVYNNYLGIGSYINTFFNMPPSAINNATTWTYFLVINPSSTANYIMVKQHDGIDTQHLLTMGINNLTIGTTVLSTPGSLFFRPYNAGSYSLASTPLLLSTNQLVTLKYDGTYLYIYINGSLFSTTSGSFDIKDKISVTNCTVGIMVGNGSITNPDVTSFSLGEMFFYKYALTTATIQKISTNLISKWSIPSTPSTTNIDAAAITTPLSIPGLALWLDGSDTSSMTFSGTNITQWNDKSGNGYHATVASGYDAATYATASTCVNFASTTAYATSYPANPTAETMFIVANNASPSSANNTIIGGAVGARSLGFGFSGIGGSGKHGYLQNEVLWLANTVAGSYTSGTTSLVTGYVSTGYTYISTNGGSFSSAYPIKYGVFTAGTTTYLGTDTSMAKGTYYFSGNVMEIIFYNSVLSASQISQVQKYLAIKWSIRSMTPSRVPNAALWLDANDSSTVVTTAIPATYTTSLITWKDKSGNGYNFTTNSVSTTYPTTGSTTQGVLFSTTSSLVNSYIPIPANYTIILVGNLTATPSTYGRFINMGTIDGFGFVGTYTGTTNFDVFTGNGTGWLSAVTANTPTTVVVSSPSLCIMVMSVSGTTVSPFFNGTALTARTNSAATPATTGMALNGNYVSITQTVSGYFSEVILYNSALTTTQRQQVETYLGTKWGITVATTVAGMTVPTSITGCTLWLDGKDSTQFVNALPAPAVAAGAWYDKSGLSNDMSLTVGTVTYGVSNLGLNAVTFQSASMLTSANYTTLSSSETSYIFIVCRSTGTSTADVIRMVDIFAADYSIQFSAALKLVLGGYGTSFRVNGVYATSTTVTAGFNLIGVSGVFISGSTRFSLSTTYNNYDFTGDICEVIVYTNITQEQILFVEAYLMAKWGCGRQFWIDASDSTSITSSAGLVSVVKDKSGNGYNLTQATSADQPSLISNYLNIGTPTSNTYFNMNVSAINNATKWTFFYVINPISNTNYITIKQNDGYDTQIAFTVGITTTSLGQYQTGTAAVVYAHPYNTGNTFTSSYPLSMSRTQIVTMTYDGTVLYYYLNGSLLTATTGSKFDIPNYTSVTSCMMGRWIQNGTTILSGYTKFKLGEMAFYNYSLSAAIIQQISANAIDEWAIPATSSESITTITTPIIVTAANTGVVTGAAPYNRSFQPTDITGCTLWLDGADFFFMTLVGSNVTAWYDKSGVGNVATGVSNPQLISTGGVQFTGTQYFTLTSAYLHTCTIFLVGSGDNTTLVSGGLYYWGLNGTGGTIINNSTSSTPLSPLLYNNGGLTPNGGFVSGNNLASPFIASVVQIPGTSTTAGYYNGTSAFTVSYPAAGTATAFTTIGAASGGTNKLIGNIYEIIMYNSALSIPQRQQVEAYLAWKWQLISTLPALTAGSKLPAFATKFTPKIIPGCLAWWDCSDYLSMTTTLTTVSAIIDKSGNDNTMTTITGTVSTATLNQLDAISFPTTTAYMRTSNYFSLVAGVTSLFIVIEKPSSWGPDTIAMAFTGSDLTPYNILGDYSIRLSSTNGGTLMNDYTNSALRNWGYPNVWVNGTSYTSTTANIPLQTGFNIIYAPSALGGSTRLTLSSACTNVPSTGTRTFTAKMGEVILYNAVPSTYQRQQMEGYLAWKWGCVGNLPAKHPYQTYSP